MIQEDFSFYRPCEALRPYIRYYWVFRSNQSLKTLTFPIGCPQFIFHKGTPLFIPELDACQSRFAVSGQVNYPAHLSSVGIVEMIVVVFHPYTMSAFLNLPLSVLYNQEVSGSDLENRWLNELEAQVFDCADEVCCIHLIEQWLLHRVQTQTPQVAYNMKRVAASFRQLFAMPGMKVHELASVACLGKKQFERLFSFMVGMNPKEYARIVRFQKSLWYLQHSTGNLNQAQLAFQCGYADQSHFIREFKHFSGHTPLSLLDACEPYSDLFTAPV